MKVLLTTFTQRRGRQKKEKEEIARDLTELVRIASQLAREAPCPQAGITEPHRAVQISGLAAPVDTEEPRVPHTTV